MISNRLYEKSVFIHRRGITFQILIRQREEKRKQNENSPFLLIQKYRVSCSLSRIKRLRRVEQGCTCFRYTEIREEHLRDQFRRTRRPSTMYRQRGGVSQPSFITSAPCNSVCVCGSRLHAAGHLPAGRRSRSLRGELQRTGDIRGAVRRALRHQERLQRPRAVTSNATSAGLRAHPGPNAALQHAGFGHDGVRTPAGQSQYRQALQPVLPVRQRNEGR